MTPTNHAAVLLSADTDLIIQPFPYPIIEHGSVIIKTRAVALNPIDWKLQREPPFPVPYPVVLGGDVAGEVVEVGDGVEGVRVGDRVMAMAGSLGSKGSSGAFAHYVLALAVTTVPIPPDMSFTDASVLPTITGTAASALYDPDFLSLSYPPSHTAFSRSSPHDPLPESTGTGEEPTGTEEEEREKVVFVYGGSSGVGSSSIQLARASGYTVFTAAGQGNFEMVRRLGAAEIFDHKSPKIMADISAALSGKRLVGIVDSITTRETMIICRSIARSAGVGLVVGMLPGLEGVDSGVEYRMVNGTKFKGSKVARRIFKEYLPIALANHQIVSSPRAEVVGHGLDQIQNGLDKLREGVSGKKLVVDM